MAKKEGITYEQIIGDLQQKKYLPVYFLMGEEPYYIDKISEFIEQNVLSESERDFNLTVFYAGDKETSMTAVIDAAKRFPMMAEYQVIIVKEAQNFKEKSDTKNDSAADGQEKSKKSVPTWEQLEIYLKNPQKSTLLVFCHKHKTVDTRKKWVKDVAKVGLIFESPKLREYEIEQWVKTYALQNKIEMDSKAVAMLCEFLGTNLSKIVNEIDKLIITLPADSRRISAEHIEKNIGISKDYNVFELQDALVKKEVLKANRIVRYFADNNKANPIQKVLPTLFNFFTHIMLYHYLPEEVKLSGRENYNEKRDKSAVIARELGVPPYPAAENIATAARIYSAGKAMRVISYIREAEAKSKGFGTVNEDESEIYKELVFKILH